MSREQPWPRHHFVPGAMTPLSCIKCGKAKADEAHLAETDPEAEPAESLDSAIASLRRRRMPRERKSVTHKGKIHATGGTFGIYLTAGMYEDGTLGEIFIRGVGKEGSTIQGLMDGYATMLSIALQHGTPLDMIARKFSHTRFEPMGPTEDQEIGYAFSLLDYVVRWLAGRFGDEALNADLARISAQMMERRQV